jgi:hypothetical protein
MQNMALFQAPGNDISLKFPAVLELIDTIYSTKAGMHSGRLRTRDGLCQHHTPTHFNDFLCRGQADSGQGTKKSKRSIFPQHDRPGGNKEPDRCILPIELLFRL